jgi:hypothetical protein
MKIAIFAVVVATFLGEPNKLFAEVTTGNLEAFIQSISGNQVGYSLEFIEGEVSENATNKIEVTEGGKNGSFIVSVSQRHYKAICQSNAFALLEDPSKVVLGNKKTISVFGNYGRLENNAWLLSDRDLGVMVSMDGKSTNYSVKNAVAEIKRAESKTWCAATYGLPPMLPSSLIWSGQKFEGKTIFGSKVSGEVFIDNNSKLVSGISYKLSGETDESAIVLLSYTSSNSLAGLPNMIEKRIDQSVNPYYAAEYSFSIKMIERTILTNLTDSSVFMEPIQKVSSLISNGVPMARVGKKFLAGKAFEEAVHPTGTVKQNNKNRILALTGFLIINFAFIGFVAFRRKNKKNK